ncbi:MAG: hypothetical protein EU539_13770 [Promethearchaeota archaeon]|nr:MAG: hypothetical protein EU539_13770 [Candidatus Lokiarchaeota archaeon]
MADFHAKSFFGQKSGIIVNSPAKNVPYIFLQSIKRKNDGNWEKPSQGEGRSVKISIEEIICILEVLRRRSANWRGYHVFKEYKTEIYVGWESEAREVLIIKIGDYKKKLRFPNTNFLALLLEHILKEKIEFATSGSFESKSKKVREMDYGVFTEHITARDGLQVIETTEYNVDKEPMEINAKIKIESPKALLITLDTGNEFWVPKSTIHNKYEHENKESFQKLIIDKWIIEKNIIGLFESYE